MGEHDTHSWPKYTVDSQKGREWVHLDPPRYYVGQDDDGMWTVTDRNWDLAATRKFKRKQDCLRNFYANHEHSFDY